MRPYRPLWLASVAEGRDNNFNLIRLLAATGVFVSHTVMITQGREAVPQAMWSLGTISVWVFFAISGYLIAGSFERRVSLGQFAAARCLRIFPALLVCILLTAFLVGPSQSALALRDYLAHPETYRFVLGNAALFWETRDLPGVFADHPVPYAQITFWSLKYEVLCYLALALLGLAGGLATGRRFAGVLAIFVTGWVLVLNAGPGVPDYVITFGELAFVFLLGAGAYVFRRHVLLSAELALALVLATWWFWWTPAFHILMPLAVAYGTLWAAFVPAGAIRAFNRLGDYSYGVYIFGVLVQQLLVSALGAHTPVENLIYGLPFALGLAALSWHLIEKPCLGLKPGSRGVASGSDASVRTPAAQRSIVRATARSQDRPDHV
jgi:peptidoglycan/LPS O-acetylase OafA/YrhL